jgi:multidrug transporter EmrE-like cation transporter
MQYLVLAILFSSGIAIIFKLFTRFGINNIQAITVNYVLAVLAGYFACQSEFVFSEIFYKPWFYLAIVVGFSFITTFFIYAISAQKAGVAISAVASRMSVVIPVIVGIAIYGEKISIVIVTGIILSLFAFYFIFAKKSGIKVTAKYFILPLLLFFGFGFNDSMLKHSQKLYISVSNEYFQFLTVVFFIAFVLGFIAFVILTIKNKEKLKFKNLNAGLILGVFNFLSTYFFLKGMDYFDSSVYFPILNTGIVTMGALTGRFFFKEDFSIKNWIGILLAICAIFLLRLG